ncbi:MAG: hypothetical protein KJ718_04065 [Nanoarchaeota archaeon]|nr:hypothetical protein [Nanoarchaeota archaeon]MBU1051704.1 hypothetical protein [Nanoarchaeota archaeon]MBU1987993.1 hypothetical protein [Nanoarchaeota archaeon]
MKPKDFFNLFGKGLKDIYKNFLILVLSILLGFILFIISQFGSALAPRLQTTISNVIWTIVVGLVSLVLVSYFFAGLIGMAKKTVKGKAKRKDFTLNANKFWFKNFQIVLIMLAVGILIWGIAHYGAFFIGKAFGLNLNAALLIFILIYFAGLVGILIFFTFSSFFLVVNDLNVLESVQKSMKFVKKNYLGTLSLSVVFFVIYFLIDSIEGILGDALIYAVVLPFVVFVMVRFVLTAGLKK